MKRLWFRVERLESRVKRLGFGARRLKLRGKEYLGVGV